MLKIEKTLEIRSIAKTSWGGWNQEVPAQHTHFQSVNHSENVLELPYMSSFHLVLPLGAVNLGDKFKLTIEKIDENNS